MKNVTCSASHTSLSGDPPAPEVAPTPDEVCTRWLEKFTHIRVDVAAALIELAHGRLANDDHIQTAFCLLLKEEQEAFDTCLEIFEAHHRVREAAAGRPVTTSLRLTLPQDWYPDYDKMEALFKRLRVDSLTVDAGASPFPTAGCHCIAILLKGGLSELSIGGSLAAPDVVAQALKHSQLRSMEFLGSSLPTRYVMTQLDWEPSVTARVLADALQDCSTLELLAIHDERMLKMGGEWEKLLLDGPKLRSLALSLKRADFDDDKDKDDTLHLVKRFLQYARGAKALSDFSLTASPSIAYLDAAAVQSAILAPLSGHPGLSSVELRSMPKLACTLADMRSQAHARVFAASCPSLEYFVWEADASDLSVDAIRNFKLARGNLYMPAESMDVIVADHEALGRMKNLALIGHPLATGPTTALAHTRYLQRSRMDLDLRECLIDLESAFRLETSWKYGPSTAKLMLPTTLDRYYLPIEDNIWGIAQNAARNGFVLSQGGGLDQATCNRAIATFDALAPALRALMRDIHQQLAPSAAPLLENNVQAFMHAALSSAPSDAREVSTGAFSLAAKAIVEQLVNEERTPTAVRLNALNSSSYQGYQAALGERQTAQGNPDPRSNAVQLVQMEVARHAAPHSNNTSATAISTNTTAEQAVDDIDPTQFLVAPRAEWSLAFEPPCPRGMKKSLQCLAKGYVLDEAEMQPLFLHMVSRGAFTAFAAVFETYRKIREAEAKALGDPPFKSSLVLELPHDWRPDTDKMNAALQRIKVDTLTLKPDVLNLHLTPEKRAEVTAEQRQHLSSAACLLVATLLKGGTTTTLNLGGVPGYPGTVAEAMKDSQLHSLTLLGVPTWTHYLVAHVDSYKTLATGALSCPTLKHVAIRDEKLFDFWALPLYDSPHVNALEVSLSNSMNRSNIAQFMEAARKLPALSTVTVHFDVKRRPGGPVEPVDVIRAQAAVFKPLTGNATLTTLDMNRMPMKLDHQLGMHAVPNALMFSASCPSLKQVSWSALPSARPTVALLRAFKNAGGDLRMTGMSTRIAQAHAQPHANLTTLAFTGFFLPAGPMQAWSTALAQNRSLRHLDLSGCLMDAQSAATLYASLQQNPLFKTLKVSNDYNDYYFSFEGHIGSIAQNSDGSDFALSLEGAPDEDLERRAALAFNAVKDGLRKLIEMSKAPATLDVSDKKGS